MNEDQGITRDTKGYASTPAGGCFLTALGFGIWLVVTLGIEILIALSSWGELRISLPLALIHFAFTLIFAFVFWIYLSRDPLGVMG